MTIDVVEPADLLEEEEETTGERVDASAPVEDPESNVLLTGAATFLAVAAAGWMVSGVFRGNLPRLIGFAGAIIGVAPIVLSYRTKRPSFIQYLAVPAAVVAGALLVIPFAHGGNSSLPSLVTQAIRGGGLSQPPVPFDPGWRFILLVLIAVIGAASASLATSLSKPKLGIMLPAPLVFGAALVQPAGATLVSSVVALVLLVASFGVSYGVDLERDGSTSGGFELRRLGRGAGVLALLVLALVVLSQLGFLLPKTTHDQVIPPKKPQVPPAAPDRVLFTYSSDKEIPIRLGVLDVYRGVAWLTPPYDSGRLQKLPVDGTVIPGAKRGDVKPGEMPGLRPAIGGARTDLAVHFVVKDLSGHILPDVQNPDAVPHKGFALQIDPRTQALRLPNLQAQSGLSYTVQTRQPPGAGLLRTAGPPPAGMKEYLQIPPAPPAVAAILATAPTNSAFDRLQYVRNAYYQKVVAAGPGNPVDIPPARVQQLLEGKDASPFEITAGEVLLARWAGVPARMGYGYFGGDRVGDTNTFSVRPVHGATWLEAYFDGFGWVPIIGIPPKAKASITPAKKNSDPSVRPTNDIALLVYVPVREQTFEALFQKVRFWLLRALPWVLALVLFASFYPALFKMARRQRRRRWALSHGPPQRIAVAYSEFRDTASDFNIGTASLTPLDFLSAIDDDAEHRELAWLVTRALWGDLGRDLRPEDVAAAEEMSASVVRRLRRAAGGVSRAVAAGSRASLRAPYSTEIPNLWPHLAVRRRLRTAMRRRRSLALVPGAAVVLAAVLLLGGCSSTAHPNKNTQPAPTLPARVVPATFEGLVFNHEAAAEANFAKAGPQALVSAGRVYSVHKGNAVVASIQVEAFKPGLGARYDVDEGVLHSFGGQFQLTRIGVNRVYTISLPDQLLLLWFPPDGRYLDLEVARPDFTEANRVLAEVIAYQQGATGPIGQLSTTPPVDPRRLTAD